MNWKSKALLQNVVAILPKRPSYSTYYWMQRTFGDLKRINVIEKLAGGKQTWEILKKNGYDPAGKVSLEVGTGRIPLIPLAFWLMGAKKIFTIDLNPYLKEELIRESLD